MLDLLESFRESDVTTLKRILYEILAEKISVKGVSEIYDRDSVVVLRDTLRSNINEDLRSKFDEALYQLLLEVNQDLGRASSLNNELLTLLSNVLRLVRFQGLATCRGILARISHQREGVRLHPSV